MKKGDLKNNIRGGLDSLIRSTSDTNNVNDAVASKSEDTIEKRVVHCNFVMNKQYHINLKVIAAKKGQKEKEALKEALDDFFLKNKDLLDG